HAGLPRRPAGRRGPGDRGGAAGGGGRRSARAARRPALPREPQRREARRRGRGRAGDGARGRPARAPGAARRLRAGAPRLASARHGLAVPAAPAARPGAARARRVQSVRRRSLSFGAAVHGGAVRSSRSLCPRRYIVDREQALDVALGQIERQFGKGSVMRMSDQAAVAIGAVSTGSLALDLALGIGGLPRGRIVEVFGPEASGKTTLVYHVIAEAQRRGGI